MPVRHGRHRISRPTRSAAAVVAAALAATAAVAVVTVGGERSALARTRAEVLNSAAAYAKSKGYTVGISVYDTKLGHLYGSGSHGSTFASESVIKVFIAARLLVQGRMHGTTSKRAYKMITQSDDAIANSFYGSVGGDGLLSWAEKRYHVNIGSGVIRSGYWGSYRFIPDGLVRAYAKLKADKVVSGWLRYAMHRHTTYGSDGFYQAFGLPQAAAGYEAVKQGWGNDYSYSKPNASMNSTGYVNGDRYAVAILARGPASSYGSRLGGVITHIAKTILPGGYFPAAYPRISTVSTKYASKYGGQTLSLRGTNFSSVSRVIVGATNAKFTVRSSGLITLATPPTPSGRHSIRVVTSHGTSPKAWVLFGTPPVVTAVNPSAGPTSGGQVVTLTGSYVSNVTRVVFGTASGSYRSAQLLGVTSNSVRFRTPPYAAGTVPIRVANGYGVTATATYTFGGAARAATTSPSTPSAPSTASTVPPSGTAPTTPTAPGSDAPSPSDPPTGSG